MSIFNWEDIFVEEWIAQKQRDKYLDMRNAHILAKKQVSQDTVEINIVEYQKVYKQIFDSLSIDFDNRLSGHIRKRSTNVW